MLPSRMISLAVSTTVCNIPINYEIKIIFIWVSTVIEPENVEIYLRLDILQCGRRHSLYKLNQA